MRKLIPIILLLIGTSAGVAAGIFLRPVPDDSVSEVIEEVPEVEPEPDPLAVREYVKMSNQFVVPLVKEGNVSALVVLSLSVEVMPGAREQIFAREPKLRDSFLSVLFDYANIGAFDGEFTDVSSLDQIRSSLKKAAKRDGSDDVTDILILEIARQDL